ncbi:exo-alpha-sialidase [Paenibacillus mesophilus]|uniref:sialidase family protein n=1 Tax=Paenibacillus mesophilus TaxID=2582849 RepID=UPI00110D96EA|nr:sialidase family protein [Paenibacillus mesophilus]TMV46675.1 exo-alpha-sialidase [Paenibacillus mesophilus]
MLSKKGKIVCDIRPKEGYPRNSEGAFLDLSDGRILFIYSRFYGETYSDTAKAGLAARYSADDGETWSDDEWAVKPDDHGARNVMSVSLLRMQNGDIGLFYLIRYGFQDMRLHLRRSSDEGKTWGEAVCCIPGPGYYVTNNDRVVRLSSGRLIIPAAYHKMRSDDGEHWRAFDSRGVVHFIVSDDDGATWKEAQNYCAIPAPRSKRGLLEPGVVELASGVLWGWARTDMGCQYEMYSMDGGDSWSLPAPSFFTSPDSPLSMKRMPGGPLLAVWNPIPNYPSRAIEKHTAGRTPLIGAISRDEGKTWGHYFAMEREEEDRGGYCYTAIHFVRDESLLLAYCAGEAEDVSCLSRLRIRKIRLADIAPE